MIWKSTMRTMTEMSPRLTGRDYAWVASIECDLSPLFYTYLFIYIHTSIQQTFTFAGLLRMYVHIRTYNSLLPRSSTGAPRDRLRDQPHIVNGCKLATLLKDILYMFDLCYVVISLLCSNMIAICQSCRLGRQQSNLHCNFITITTLS